MEWPFRRFLKAFDAYQRGLLCDQWERRKIALIGAIYANTNMDSEENDRPGAIEKLERAYDSIIARIWNGEQLDGEEEEVEQEWQSDFMRAGRRLTVPQIELPGEQAIGALPA